MTDTIPAADVLAFIARERAARDNCRLDAICELIGDAMGVTGWAIEKWLRQAADTGTVTVDLADATITALGGSVADVPALAADVEAPAGEGWCPRCREQVMVVADGRCTWCDTQTGAGETTPPEARHANAGVPYLMGDDVLADARELYASGLSMRQVAERLHARTGYATAGSFRSALYDQFRRRGWTTRDVRSVVIARNYRHGKGARDRDESAYRKMLRAERGRDCRGVTRSGRPCARRAMADGDYCVSHDPTRAERRAEQLAEMRRKWAETWEPCRGVVEHKDRKGQPCQRRAIPGTGYCHAHRHQATGDLREAA